MTEHRTDIYTRITAEIIAAIETGAGRYRMPWHHNGSAISRPTNVISQRRYRGANVIVLWIAAEAAGYASGVWGTYRQWHEIGGQVRRGEKGTAVMLWKQMASTSGEDGEDDETPARRRIFARSFTVFNAAQVDGYTPPPVPVLSETERFADAERFIDHLGITTVFEGSKAYYRPSNDTVYMPPFSQFRDATSFYGVRLHEWWSCLGSGAPPRSRPERTLRLGRIRHGRNYGGAAERDDPGRSRPRASSTPGSRRVYFLVVDGPEERAACDRHRRQQGAGSR
jgi:antirestriction protein ArdC